MKENTDSSVRDCSGTKKLFAGRYRIVELLGKGGMGKVYLAEDTFINNEKIAIKVMNGNLSNDPESAERFLREIQLTRKVTHQNVIRTYDAGQTEKRLYFTMEYVNGRTLKDFLKKEGKLPWQKVASIVIQVCDGLAAIHKEGIVHRDLKPSNVIQSELFVCKIADFGVARPFSSNFTSCNEIVGSISYMAPEVWTGEGIGAPADLYSLGIMIFELITGHLPFEAESAPELMCKHLQEIPPPLCSLDPEVPRWLSDLTAKLLIKDCHSRPAVAGEVAEFVLERFEQAGEYNSSTLCLHSLEEAKKLQLALLPPIEPCDPNEAGYFAGRTEIVETDEDEWLLNAGIEAELPKEKKLPPPKDPVSQGNASREQPFNPEKGRFLRNSLSFFKRVASWCLTFLIISCIWWGLAYVGSKTLILQHSTEVKSFSFQKASLTTAVFTLWLGLLLSSPLFFPAVKNSPLRKIPSLFVYLWVQGSLLALSAAVIFSFLRVPWYYNKFRPVPTSIKASFKEVPKAVQNSSPYLVRALFLMPDTTAAKHKKNSYKQLRPALCIWYYTLIFFYIIYLLSNTGKKESEPSIASRHLYLIAFSFVAALVVEEHILLPYIAKNWEGAKNSFNLHIGANPFAVSYGAFSLSIFNWLLVSWFLSPKAVKVKI